MDRHETDRVSLVSGVLFAGTGLAWLTGIGPELDLDGRWVLPSLLVGLGVAGLLSSRPERGPSSTDENDTAPVSTP